MRLTLLALAATASLLSAQTNKVVPAGFEFVEGPTSLTYPFGRADAAIQVVIDADQLTLGQGVITGMKLRQSQTTGNFASYTKNYSVTLYQVAVTAATMASDPAVNIGSVIGTTVFNGSLPLPAAGALAVTPADFAIDLPFSAPFLFDGSLGNLLLVLQTTDTTPPAATNYPLDAVRLLNSAITGIVAPIDTAGCTVNGNSLTIAGNAATAIVGGTISYTLTGPNAAGLPIVFAGIGLTRQQLDLGLLGMPGCTSWLGMMDFQLLLASGGTYPSAGWSLPNNPIFEGAGLVAQAVAFDTNASLNTAVTSNGLAFRVGSNTFPVRRMHSSFRGATGGTWSQGTNGEFTPIIQFQGVFP